MDGPINTIVASTKGVAKWRGVWPTHERAGGARADAHAHAVERYCDELAEHQGNQRHETGGAPDERRLTRRHRLVQGGSSSQSYKKSLLGPA